MDICQECGEQARGPVCSRGRNAGRPHVLGPPTGSGMWSGIKSPAGFDRSSLPPALTGSYGRSPSGRGGSARSPGRSGRPRSSSGRRRRSSSRSRSHSRSRRSRSRSRSPRSRRRRSISPSSFGASHNTSWLQGSRAPSPPRAGGIKERPSYSLGTSGIRIWKGMTVERNPAYWGSGNQDGGGGKKGTVTDVDGNWVRVKWHQTGIEGTHRWGAEGAYDVSVVTPLEEVSEVPRFVEEREVREVQPHIPPPEDHKVFCKVRVEGLRDSQRHHYKLQSSSQLSQLLGELFQHLPDLSPSDWHLYWEPSVAIGGRDIIALKPSDTPQKIGMQTGITNIQNLLLSMNRDRAPLSPTVAHQSPTMVSTRRVVAVDEPLHTIPVSVPPPYNDGSPGFHPINHPGVINMHLSLSDRPRSTSPTRLPHSYDIEREREYELSKDREREREREYEEMKERERREDRERERRERDFERDDRISLLESENQKLRQQLERQQQQNHPSYIQNTNMNNGGILSEVEAAIADVNRGRGPSSSNRHPAPAPAVWSSGGLSPRHQYNPPTSSNISERDISPHRAYLSRDQQQHKPAPLTPNSEDTFYRLKEVFSTYLSFGLNLPGTETDRMVQFVLGTNVGANNGIPDSTISVIITRLMGTSQQRSPLTFEEFSDALHLVGTVVFPREEYPLQQLLPSFR